MAYYLPAMRGTFVAPAQLAASSKADKIFFSGE
jgi:hypothetical protein